MTEPEPPEQGTPAPDGGRNLPVAIATGLALAGLLFGALFWSRLAFLVLVGAVLLVAQHELYGVLERRGHRPASLLGLVAGAVIVVGAHANGPAGATFGLSLAVVATMLWFLADPKREGAVTGVAATLLGVAYVPLLGAHVILIRALPDGIALTIAAIGVAAFSDIGAYAAGSMIGRRPIAPRVSPSKTWEGALGAVVVVFAVALGIGPMLGPLDVGSSAALAGVAVIAAPLGDLTESLLKRDLEVKDMGRLLPGHGGVLDRIDGLLFMVPAAYWLLRAVVA